MIDHLKIYDVDDRETILSCCLASRDFYEAAIPWLYRSVGLDVVKLRRTRMFTEAVEGGKEKYVHDIFIPDGTPQSVEHRFLMLEDLVQRLPALRQFL